MAHELTIREDGFVEMAFVGETPWHELGQSIDENSSIEDWQKAAGMDWTIESSPVGFVANGNNQTFHNQNVLYRSDTNAPLSVVTNRYKAVQPKEVLEFFRDLVDESGFRIHTAGTLKGGKHLWALAETGKYGEITKGDGVGGFLLLSTSCDKSLATTARFTTVRVVCNNTLTSATSDRSHCVSFSHVSYFDHVAVKAKLGTAVESFGAFLEMGKYLQKQRMDILQAHQFVQELIKPVNQVKTDDSTQNRTYRKIMQLFDGEAKGVELAGYTKWGMLNAVTEYYDHHAPSRSNDARLDNAWFGMGNSMKDRAVALLTA